MKKNKKKKKKKFKDEHAKKMSVCAFFKRKLRKNPTRGEMLLKRLFVFYGIEHQFQTGWYKKLETFYITDFYIPKIKTIIEVDGDSHKNKKEKDQKRDKYFKKRGINVVRVRLLGG